MDFLDKEIEQYALAHTEQEPDLLYEIFRETWQKQINPRMLAGHMQGRVISMLSHMISPKYILEIGTYTGYSALCWSEGLKPDGHIHTIDSNEELEDTVTQYFERAGKAHCIHMHIGDATAEIKQLDFPWDIVFIDADKANYQNYYDAVITKIPSGAYIIADNVLWSGKILDDTSEDIDTIALQKFNTYVHHDERVQEVLFPIRDGLMICRKR